MRPDKDPSDCAGEYAVNTVSPGKSEILITSIPFAVDKATIVERIGELILNKKIPQLVDRTRRIDNGTCVLPWSVKKRPIPIWPWRISSNTRHSKTISQST